MSICELPDDLMILILVRLPPEFLGQLKSVSKSWNALISCQKFMKLHLNQSHILQKPNVLFQLKDQIHMVEFSTTREDMDFYSDFHSHYKRLHYLPELLDNRFIIQIVGSSNGLLCLLLAQNQSSRSSDEYDLALCNPLTKSTWDLPGNQWRRLVSDESLYGFWYDDVNDDYKVVIIKHISFEKGIHEYECEVYSLVSNSWSTLSSFLDFSYDYKVLNYADEGVLFNCALYWIIHDNDYRVLNFILAFDLRTYKHKIVPMPEFTEEEDYPEKLITLLNGSLVLCNSCCSDDVYNWWVMKDSWIRITIDRSFAQKWLTPLALLEDNHKRILICYDDVDEDSDRLEFKDLVSHQDWTIRVPFSSFKMKQLQFVGSLVQPYPPSICGYAKICTEDAVRNFDKFHIHVNGLSIDSHLPEHVRRKYYDLCCSKNSFLHERFVPGVQSKLAASMIIEAVNIVDCIKSCKITTSKDEFEKWGESLRSFQLLGMNVGFLRDRLRLLLTLAFDSEQGIEAKKYWKVKSEKARIEDKIEYHEKQLGKLKDSCKKYGAEVDTLKPKAKSYKLMFREKADAPW